MLDGFKSDVLYLYSKFNLEIFIMKITNPKLEVVRFNADDVIATSLYYMKAADYNALYGTSFTSNYVEFQGSMVAPDKSGVWGITNIYGAKAAKDDDIAGLMSGGSYTFPDVGVTVDMSDMAPVARQAYNAFKGDDGISTHGVTYYEQYWNQ